MKTIVTHISPDLDAIASCWIIQRYLPGWETAQIKFVPAGSTLDSKPPDTDPNIIHVDTGFGDFDHHQSSDFTCAAKKVFEYVKDKGHIPQKVVKPLEQIVQYVNDTDHFREVFYPDPAADYFEFCLHKTIDGLRNQFKDELMLIQYVFVTLDAALYLFKNRIQALLEIEKGYVFTSKYGKSIAMQTTNEETIKLAQKMGFVLAIRKDPKKGSIRIKTIPGKQNELTPIYDKIKKIDTQGTWFLHASKNMLLNGSSRNPNHIPSPLTIAKVIEIVKQV